MMTINFKLNPRLENDSYFIKELPLSSMRISKNANFPWVILIPRIENITEIFELQEEDQIALTKEIHSVSKYMKNYFCADKINIASFGNEVSQLHIHIIARFKNDIIWPKPIWNNNSAPTSYDEKMIKKITTDLQKIEL